jgi:hypothetical protein
MSAASCLSRLLRQIVIVDDIRHATSIFTAGWRHSLATSIDICPRKSRGALADLFPVDTLSFDCSGIETTSIGLLWL